MSYLDKRRILSALSQQLFREEPLSSEQMKYLSVVFWQIANGEDANIVLAVKPRRGQKMSDAVAKQRMSLILHWVAGAVNSDTNCNGKKLTIVEACEAAIDSIVPIAKQLYPGADDCVYDVEYLVRCWSEPTYRHMRSVDRQFFDDDFPY